MDNNIIETSEAEIVIRETPIRLSDEKLKSALLRAYEKGQENATKPKFHNHFWEFLSVAVSLLYTLLTSEFKSVGCVSSDFFKYFTIVLFIACATIGIILMLIAFNEKTKSKTEERDIAVNDIFKLYTSNNVGVSRKRTIKKAKKKS